jgi:hypothetical protein
MQTAQHAAPTMIGFDIRASCNGGFKASRDALNR